MYGLTIEINRGTQRQLRVIFMGMGQTKENQCVLANLLLNMTSILTQNWTGALKKALDLLKTFF